jgi:hypothetical protein
LELAAEKILVMEKVLAMEKVLVMEMGMGILPRRILKMKCTNLTFRFPSK